MKSDKINHRQRIVEQHLAFLNGKQLNKVTTELVRRVTKNIGQVSTEDFNALHHAVEDWKIRQNRAGR